MSLKKNETTLIFHNKVGTILQKARVDRNLSIEDVSQETSINPRYIKALEEDDFSKFPGETYTIGFLGNYADFLNLDKVHLVHLFHQQQIDTTPVPLTELTQSRGFFVNIFDVFHIPAVRLTIKFVFPLALLLAVFFMSLRFFDVKVFQAYFDFLQNEEPYCGGERKVRIVQLPLIGASPQTETLSSDPPDSIRLNVQNMIIKLCLKQVQKEGAKGALGLFHARINDKKNFHFQIREQESMVLSSHISEFQGLQKKIQFTALNLHDHSARVKVQVQELVRRDLVRQKSTDESEADSIAPANESIQVSLEFLQECYVEWMQDGRLHHGRLINAGEVHTYEAKKRLEIKLGNAGGVRIYLPNARPRIAGPPARIVKLEYRRIPDPLDPDIYHIKENIKAVQ